MLGRIVEVSNDKRHLSVYRGFMLVHSTGEDRQEVGRVPLDDMAGICALTGISMDKGRWVLAVVTQSSSWSKNELLFKLHLNACKTKTWVME